jgi:beta-glucanase (GH16 family)
MDSDSALGRIKMKTAKVLIPLFLILTIWVPVSQAQWQLVWSDEFDAGIGSDWVFETGMGEWGWGNNELQYYRSENAVVENGALRIQARLESYGGASYTSARMKTQGNASWRYGKIEARIAMPRFMGVWPAFWMLGESISSEGWPACGEIDIMEHINTENIVYGAAHWDYNGQADYNGDISASVTDYHVYAIEWDAQYIRWFLDGNQYLEMYIGGGINGTEEFHKNAFIILNMAIGGTWPGYTIDESAFPANMYVDYVRVYQQNADTSTDIATLYQHCGYGGYAVNLDEGSYTSSQLKALGMVDNDLSSIKVMDGYQVTLYQNDNFLGASLVKTADDDCLVDDDFNDTTSSVVVSKASSAVWSLTIEAEDYADMYGIETESCDEGGLNVGYIDTGDWMAYSSITIPETGIYTVAYRVAALNDGGRLSLDLNAGSIALGELAIPATGAWQNWATIQHTVYINAGTYNVGIYAQQGGWNLDFITISRQ